MTTTPENTTVDDSYIEALSTGAKAPPAITQPPYENAPASTETTGQPQDDINAQVAMIRAQNEALQRELQALRQAQYQPPAQQSVPQQPQQPQQPSKLFDVDQSWKNHLPPELAQHSGAVDVIGKVVEAVLANAVEPKLRTHFDTLRNTQQQLATDNELIFSNALNTVGNDIKTAQAHPKWNEFLNSKVPFTNMSVLTAMEEAYASRDMSRLQSIVSSFLATNKAAQAPRPAFTQGQQAVPFNNAPAPATSANMIPASSIMSAARDLAIGRISSATYKAFEKAYNQAAAEGRIIQGQ